ncbi:hypothetical protein OROMI_026125 [Orobanche minor]
MKPGSHILYLGNICEITVLQLSDLVGLDGLVYVRGLTDDFAGNDSFRKDYRMVVGIVDVILADIVHPEKMNYIAINAKSYLRTGGHYLISTHQKNNNSTSQVKDLFADHDFIPFDTRTQFKSNELVMLETIGRGHAMPLAVSAW